MEDMFGNKIDVGRLLELKRGDHEFLSKFFSDGKKIHKVKKIGTYFLERQIHDGGEIVRYAVYSGDKWENSEKYREGIGKERRSFEVYSDS